MYGCSDNNGGYRDCYYYVGEICAYKQVCGCPYWTAVKDCFVLMVIYPLVSAININSYIPTTSPGFSV